MYNDWFCRIDQKGKRAWYADISMNAFEMPLLWAKKIVQVFHDGNIKRAMHMVDMVQKKLG